jgi:lysophospholipase L1-like esterase
MNRFAAKISVFTARAAIALAALACSLSLLHTPPALAQITTSLTPLPWSGTWGAAPAGPPLASATTIYTNQTLRLIVHTSTSGSQVRVRFSNELSPNDLSIGAAHVAVRYGGSQAIVTGSDRTLTFNGAGSVLVRAGTQVLSDPVSLGVPALADLSVSLYLPGQARVSTLHAMATQNSYVSPAGNYAGAASLPVQSLIETWPFLTEVEVGGGNGAVVALGDSITDGLRSWGNYNYRWPDWLARRLQAAGAGYARLGVVNRGIAGNSLLSNPQVGSLAGQSMLNRFNRDVLGTAGVRYLILLAGINDISFSTSSYPVSASSLIAGYRQIISRAHTSGIKVFIATMPPFAGSVYYDSSKDQVRGAANNWIRNSGEPDAMIDFDRVLRDPSAPSRLLPAYDSGDHLHPNNTGYQVMGNTVPLSLFSAIAY